MFCRFGDLGLCPLDLKNYATDYYEPTWLWLCAISHILHITGSGVELVSDFTGKAPFSDMLQSRRVQVLDGLRHLNNAVLHLMTFVR